MYLIPNFLGGFCEHVFLLFFCEQLLYEFDVRSKLIEGRVFAAVVCPEHHLFLDGGEVREYARKIFCVLLTEVFYRPLSTDFVNRTRNLRVNVLIFIHDLCRFYVVRETEVRDHDLAIGKFHRQLVNGDRVGVSQHRLAAWSAPVPNVTRVENEGFVVLLAQHRDWMNLPVVGEKMLISWVELDANDLLCAKKFLERLKLRGNIFPHVNRSDNREIGVFEGKIKWLLDIVLEMLKHERFRNAFTRLLFVVAVNLFTKNMCVDIDHSRSITKKLFLA